MSRVRTSPTEWRDEGPASPHPARNRLAGIPVATGPSMQPVLTSGGNYLGGREAWRLPALRVTVEPRPRCGAPLGSLGEPCARRPGHVGGSGGGHRSAASVETNNLSRRKWRQAS